MKDLYFLVLLGIRGNLEGALKQRRVRVMLMSHASELVAKLHVGRTGHSTCMMHIDKHNTISCVKLAHLTTVARRR